MFNQTIEKYRELEPGGTDAWNPLTNKTEFWHRERLFFALRWALGKIDFPISNIKALDVGCGVGRSTRALIEFGIKPENITGIDLRPSAIAYAKQTNPAIDFQVVESIERWKNLSQYHLCLQCTAFSSVSEPNARLELAKAMEKALIKKGYIFWWDQITANQFAGGDKLAPAKLFQKSVLVEQSLLTLRPTINEALASKNPFLLEAAKFFQKRFGYPITHLMALFRKQ